jgi:hypothetical protein
MLHVERRGRYRRRYAAAQARGLAVADRWSKKDLERMRKRDRRRTAKERAERERWLSRPIWPAPSTEDNFSDEWSRKKLAKQCESTRVRLGWSKKRFASFQRIFAQYQRSGRIATYLKIRRDFPEVEPFILRFYSIDFTNAFGEELDRLGLDWRLIYSALDRADECDVDALCLRLIEMLVKRDEMPKTGPGHIDQRRGAISKGFVNYVMVMLLEFYTNLKRPREFPAPSSS